MNRSVRLPRPGACLGPCPERREPHDFPRNLMFAAWHGWMFAPGVPSAFRRRRFLQAVHRHRECFMPIEPALLAAQARLVRTQLAAQGFIDDAVARAFGVVATAVQRSLGVTPYDTQLLAGWWMLERRLVEMQTGEGKTLAIALAAMAAALAGVPVHVITSNDYLVERDARCFEPVCRTLGLQVDHVVAAMPAEQRRAAYAADITYVTGKELVFDYLRDRQPGGGRLPHGLCLAIVDEADSVLLDEARTPLVLSQAQVGPEQAVFYRQALFLAAQLRDEKDYTLEQPHHTVELTPNGRQRARALGERIGGPWLSAFLREETLCLALAAKHLYQRDRHYLVRDGKVLIVDQTSGRSAPGRQWARGLHQMIEVKEHCTLTMPGTTSAQLTYQRFFPRYLRLSGISGTLVEARKELLAIYGLPVAKIPLRMASRRVDAGTRVFTTTQALQAYVTERASALREAGRPCLIATGSVAESQALSDHLHGAGLPHAMLNARQDADEAHVVAAAGKASAITIATNMAGRGTDITLDEAARTAGGLHVISCQINRSARIDRQLHGRCARQGMPGSFERAIALDSVPALHGLGARTVAWLARPLLARMQQTCDREDRAARWRFFHADLQLDRLLALAGPRE